MVVQVLLRSPCPGGFTVRTCWVDNARVRTGSKLTLANSEDRRRKWEVVWVSAAVDMAVISTGWNAGGVTSRRI